MQMDEAINVYHNWLKTAKEKFAVGAWHLLVALDIIDCSLLQNIYTYKAFIIVII